MALAHGGHRVAESAPGGESRHLDPGTPPPRDFAKARGLQCLFSIRKAEFTD